MKRLLVTGLVLAMSVGITQSNAHAATYKFRHGKVVEVKAGWLTKEGREVGRDNKAREKREAELASKYVPPKVYATQSPIVKGQPADTYIVTTAQANNPTDKTVTTSLPLPAKTQGQPQVPTPAPTSKPIYTTKDGLYYSHDDEISRAIDNLSAMAKNKERELEKKAAKREAAEAKAEADAFASNTFRAEAQVKAYKRDQMFAAKPDVKIGMTSKQVVNGSKWGEPLYKSTTINATGKFEIWFYGGNAWLSLKGGKVTSINY